ncbi:hypothetical protein A1O1_07210 [Capronia coronata CBS 617.96]|uniref:AB hydrolase-1 domain-containing protein n=1 Tax=Capronia coronata CBS 617.96 TaxID=1182541 RepID=W9XSQ0_9EURO|nr:uncharacterized protein A1O1_07210 [Capronia coronata CBS 617.96]EXJ83587.1 hypothetical protein A1O1_07210 [Capronia coronata CBS 617.96]
MSKPSIILVTGSFSTPEYYADVVNAVAAQGFEIKAIHMPSVGPSSGKGREGVLPTMYDDASFIAQEVGKLADQGKHVVLVAHSYGGVPATQSVKGLPATERQKQGKSGGLVRLAYMSCLVPAVGATAASVLGQAPPDQTIDIRVDETGWMYQGNPAATAGIIVQNIPLERGEALVRSMPKHSSASFGSELTYPGYKDVPVSYLLCEEDRCIPPEVQKEGIDIIEKASGNKVDVTSIKADHCPMESSKQEVIDWLVSVAERAMADAA